MVFLKMLSELDKKKTIRSVKLHNCRVSIPSLPHTVYTICYIKNGLNSIIYLFIKYLCILIRPLLTISHKRCKQKNVN